MYNPHCCTVPTFYNHNIDYAQYQCLGQSLTQRTAAGNFLFQRVPTENQKEDKVNANQIEFPFVMELAKNSNLTPQSPPQITSKVPMTRLPWGEEALDF